MENSPQHIVVLGPGGVGGLIAALASRAGHRVTCLASESTVDVLRRDGITVSSAQFGDFTAPVEADTTLREPAGLVFVTVKATSLEAALDRLDPDAIGGALIVPLLNGVDHMTLLRERYSPEQVTGGVIRVEATRPRPGIVEHASSFADIDLASSTTDRARLDQAAATLSAIGLGVRVLDDEAQMLWAKLSFLGPFALSTTVNRAPIGVVRTEHADELDAMIDEAALVSSAECGARFDERARQLADALGNAAKSSMLRDAEAGRPTEIDAIGGALLRAGERHGIDTPVIRDVMTRLQPQQSS